MKQNLTYPALTDLDENILEVISENQPIKAIHIANILSANLEAQYRRTDINRRLYGILREDVVQDEYFQWSLWKEVGTPPEEENPDNTDFVDEVGTINTDSTVKLTYSTGQVLHIKFTKYNSRKSNGPQPEVTYVFFKSPLALSILGKQVGDIGHLPGTSYQIVEID